MSDKSAELELTSEEELLIRARRACSKENQRHLFWLTIELSQRRPTPTKLAPVVFLVNPAD